MDANRSTPAPRSLHDRQGFWLAVVSGEARGVVAALARLGLAILAVPYRLGLGAANLRWRLPGALKRSPRRVVSVGNLTVGGTGKTPMVAYLASLVAGMGGRPLVVSRGYGSTPGEPNEEAFELERLCPGTPHVQNPNRLRAIQAYAAAHPCDLAILDDGFQHRGVARDLDIVLIDALRPFGYGHLLPAGLLREPLSALRRADLIVITRAELVSPGDLTTLKAAVGNLVSPGAPVLVAEHHPTSVILPDGSRRDTEWLRGRDVAAACGIGNPEAFRRTLEALGARVARFDAFPDHYVYTQEDLNRLAAAAHAAGVKTLVTTGKDLVKWVPLLEGRQDEPPVGVAAVEVRLRMTEGEDVLRSKVGALLPGSEGRGDL